MTSNFFRKSLYRTFPGLSRESLAKIVRGSREKRDFDGELKQEEKHYFYRTLQARRGMEESEREREERERGERKGEERERRDREREEKRELSI